jgi:ClpX C4-type zinc finger
VTGKATRVRRVTSCSDGTIEVGYVPVHSAPEVWDRPIVTLQTLGSSGQPTHRMCFELVEATELLASLTYVLGYDGTWQGVDAFAVARVRKQALLDAIAAVERDYLDKRATADPVARIRALITDEPLTEAAAASDERTWVKLRPADGTFPCTGASGCGQPANAALCDRFGSAFAFACCHSHLYGDLGHWRKVRAVLSMEGREPVFSHTVTGSAGGGGAAPAHPPADPATCDHPANLEVKRFEYGVLVERHCGACGGRLEVDPAGRVSAFARSAERPSPPYAPPDAKCSFCGKRRGEPSSIAGDGPPVRHIIRGPGTTICDACTSLCLDILRDEGIDLSAEAKWARTQFTYWRVCGACKKVAKLDLREPTPFVCPSCGADATQWLSGELLHEEPKS